MAIVKEGITPSGNEQVIHRFENGYGASVIRGPYTYGGPEGLWEIAVIEWAGDDWDLSYDTTITDDVLGYIHESEVPEILSQIESLSANEEENN